MSELEARDVIGPFNADLLTAWDDVDSRPLEDVREYTNAELLAGGNPPARAIMLVRQSLIDRSGIHAVQSEADVVARAWGFPDGASIQIYEEQNAEPSECDPSLAG